MKYLTTILIVAFCHIGQSQTTVLTTDRTLAIPKLEFDQNGELKIIASATSSLSDFDFLVGNGRCITAD
jgi:hypothetical protein